MHSVEIYRLSVAFADTGHSKANNTRSNNISASSHNTADNGNHKSPFDPPHRPQRLQRVRAISMCHLRRGMGRLTKHTWMGFSHGTTAFPAGGLQQCDASHSTDEAPDARTQKRVQHVADGHRIHSVNNRTESHYHKNRRLMKLVPQRGRRSQGSAATTGSMTETAVNGPSSSRRSGNSRTSKARCPHRHSRATRPL
jgi:hypothetical protein